MNLIETPRFILSGDRSGCGKSIIAIGLAVALRKRKISFSCCVNGSDLLQAIVLKRLTRRNTRCLDANVLNNSQLLTSLKQAALGSDLMIIEGQAGLFDGFGPGSFKASDAELAALSRTPVVLVTDCDGLGNGLAALIKGYKDFAQGFDVAGCIANKCGFEANLIEDIYLDTALATTRDKIFYDSALQSFGMDALTGAIPKLSTPPHKALPKFSQFQGNISFPLQFFKDVGNLIERYVDIEALIKIANSAPKLKLPEEAFDPSSRRTKIAVSDDNCFSMSYQDNVELLRFYGAEIINFSPLADEELPERVGAVYITGAMLDGYEEELSRNNSMMESISKFVEEGGVLYSEGAGSAYLADEFESAERGNFFKGVGILKGKAVRDATRMNYADFLTLEDSILGRSGTVCRGASVGEWKFEASSLTGKILRIAVGANNIQDEGLSAGAQTASTFTFPHFGSNPLIAKNIVDAAEVVLKV